MKNETKRRASPERPEWAPTACERLRRAMADGQWRAGNELAEVGGSRFPARLYEIARGADGAPPLAYDCRAVEGCVGLFEYRLRPFADDEPRPTSPRRLARERIEQLARENAELKRRVAALEGSAAHG